MKTIFHIIILGCLIILSSCQTLERISIDKLVPGDLSFPPSVRQVGVVNNVNEHAPDNYMILESDTARSIFEVTRQVTYHRGDAKLTTESLAQSIAEANYFDVVIVSDSALRANDIAIRETALTSEEINELAEELDVDLIVALENIQLKAIRTVSYLLEGGILGTVDLKTYPTIKLYLPSRSVPLAIINGSDSIFWDGFFSTIPRAQTQVISDKKMIEEGSIFAGSILTKHFIPYWKSVERVYYNTNKSAMRDAAILVKKDNWDKAFNLWQKAYQSKKKKEQMMAAFNIALYYEMNDNIDEAILWAEKAVDLVTDESLKEDKPFVISPDTHSHYYIANRYLVVLKERKEQLTKLNMQLQRFEDELPGP